MKRDAYILHALVTVLGAFLLFAIQPIAGKHVLPYFGGASSVWAISLLFFTGTLFFGYLYVYFLTRLHRRQQVLIHVSVIVFAVFVALISLLAWHSIYPPLQWTVGSSASPARMLLLALVASIGVPYFLLSTTGPLLQYWWGISARREPYRLYALSNAGSFLALASYPLLIEPFISLHRTEGVWIASFFLYAFTITLVARHFLHSEIEGKSTDRPHEAHTSSRTSIKLAWVALAALPSWMLVAVTSQITQVIAPVPLLWIVPLAVYLATMIIAFEGYGTSGFVALALLLLGGTYVESPVGLQNMLFQILMYLAILGATGSACHAKLYALRPKTDELPLFYLLLSLGGMLGVLCVSIIAPLVTIDFWEFPLGITLATAFAASILPEAWFMRLPPRFVWATKIILIFFVVGLFANFVKTDRLNPLRTGYSLISSTRNFYGVVKVESESGVRSLVHGTTAHGMQFENADKKFLPTLYYTQSSGVGRAILYEQGHRGKRGIHVGVIGLGTATVAAYCRDTDAYTFYEIDQRIVDIASIYFSYLASCKDAKVRVGDGRMLLEKELRADHPGAYDVLVVDAFSDDSIPVHLLTVEALAVYEKHLRNDASIIAIHVSNRYLDLAPVVMRLVAERGLNAMIVQDTAEGFFGGSPSTWVVVTKDAKVLQSIAFAHVNSWVPKVQGPLWTDDYSSVLPILNLPG